MQDIRIKWGLGWIPRHSRPIRLYHVVIDGRTRCSFVNENDAAAWVADYKRKNPQQRHG